MAFIKFNPTLIPTDVFSTRNAVDLIWEELSLLRYIKSEKLNFNPIDLNHLIDQSKFYYLDAWKSNWRSAGLLFYYSFLNLSKAHLVAKKLLLPKEIKEISLYHGLTSKPQSVGEIQGTWRCINDELLFLKLKL